MYIKKNLLILNNFDILARKHSIKIRGDDNGKNFYSLNVNGLR